jgi:6-phosphogluconolactonase
MTRLPLALLVAALLFCGVPAGVAAEKELGVEWFIYVGTQTGGASQAKGIYLFKMRTSDDPNIPEFVTMTPLGLVAETPSPSFLELDSKRRLLFCVNESDDGAVSSFSIDPVSGKLAPLSRRPSKGAGPCHLALDRDGKYLLVANNRSGNVAVLPVSADGKLGEATDVKQHAAKSANPGHPQAPHPHGVAFSPDNQFAFVCDVGLDQVLSYKFDAQAGKLIANDPAFVALKPGAGPRHLVFRPDGKFAYVANELASTVTAFGYDAKAGALKELQTLSTLPGYFDGTNTVSEIGLHPSGKYLLASNCGHHSVVLFSIDAAEGTLTYIEDQSTYGTMPRHFGMDTPGKHVAVANQESGSLLILRAPENARVKPAGNVVPTPSPTCARFLARPAN